MDVKLVFYEMKITLKITDSNQDDEAKITRKISQHETTSYLDAADFLRQILETFVCNTKSC